MPCAALGGSILALAALSWNDGDEAVTNETEPRIAREIDASGARANARAAWLIGPLLLCASAGAVSLVLRGPDRLFGIALACFAALGVLWLLVCVLSSARADRT